MAADKMKAALTREKVTCELTKTKAKKCVMVAFKEEADRKEALRQIKKFFILYFFIDLNYCCSY